MAYRITNLTSQPLPVGRYVLAVSETREYETFPEIGLSRAYLESPEAQQLVYFEEVTYDNGGGEDPDPEPEPDVPAGFRGLFTEVSEEEGGYAVDLSLSNDYAIYLTTVGGVYFSNAGGDTPPANYKWDLYFHKVSGSTHTWSFPQQDVVWAGSTAPPTLTTGELLHVQLRLFNGTLYGTWFEFPVPPA